MAFAGVWGSLPQGEGVAGAAIEKIESRTSHPEKQESASTDVSSDVPDKERAKEEVYRLARSVTQHSIKTVGGTYNNPFHNKDDPTLDPHSEHFNAEAWTRTLIGIQSRDLERYPERTAGIAYRNLSVHGFGSLTDYQKTFGNYPLSLAGLFNSITGRGKHEIQILRDFEGLVKSGEMLVVLGRPGSGCSTLLKTMAGETHGFFIDDGSHINYQGIPVETMHSDFRGECMYQAEVDVHFPQLTVGQTLNFAAQARAPRNRLEGVDRKRYAAHMTDVIMAIFGLSHT